jgi:general secretion pathway protein L
MIIQIIQLTNHDVTCARFRRNGRDLTPISGIRLSYHDLSELSTLLQKQFAPLTEETRTILALPPNLVSLRELTLPISDRKKLRALLPLELSGEIAEEGENLVCDALSLANGALLAGWVTVPVVAKWIQLLTGIGLEPEVVTCSNLNWHLLIPADQQATIALVDDTALMVCQQGRPLFSRVLHSSPDVRSQTLAAVELDKRIALQSVYRLEGELLPGEEKFPLPEALSVRTATGYLPADALASPLAIALAYCTGEIFNLRSGQLAWTGKRTQLFRQMRIPLVLGAIALVLLLGELGLRWYLLARDITFVNNSITKIYHDVFPTRKKAVDETAELKAEIKRLQGTAATSEVLSFLTLLAQAKGDQIQGLSEVDFDGERFRLKGDARSNVAVASMGQKLTAAGWTVEQPELTVRPNATTLFVLKGQRGGTQQ